MLSNRSYGKLLLMCTAAMILILCGSSVCGQESNSREKPLTCKEIRTLLENNVEQARIIEQVERLQTDCDIKNDTDAFKKLVLAGADIKLLDAIKANLYSEIVIISPKPGAEAGATMKVEGKSVAVQGKYLWVFAHREGLEVWWPQGGAVAVKDDGSWRQGVFLGGANDVGFDFVVKAIWVDDKVNRELKDYLAKGEKTQQYPGISLPDGSPRAEVIVHKVRH